MNLKCKILGHDAEAFYTDDSKKNIFIACARCGYDKIKTTTTEPLSREVYDGIRGINNTLKMSKSHNQRKGQWLYNKILEANRNDNDSVNLILWNMENEWFDRIMSDYYR